MRARIVAIEKKVFGQFRSFLYYYPEKNLSNNLHQLLNRLDFRTILELAINIENNKLSDEDYELLDIALDEIDSKASKKQALEFCLLVLRLNREI